MKKAEKEFIETELMTAMKHLKRVWGKTDDYTPEDAIVAGMMCNLNALFRILNRVKTED